MNVIWVIARNDLRVFLKDKGGYVWLFGMPLIFMYLFGSAMTGSNSEPQNPKPRVIIENRDQGYLGELFVTQLEQEGFSIIQPKSSSDSDDTMKESVIAIPTDFTLNVEAAKQVKIDFLKTSKGDAQPAAMVEVRLTRAIVSLTSAIFSVVTETPDAQLTEAALLEVLSREPTVKLDVRFAGRRQVPAGFQQSVPGYLVMFVLMNLLIFGGLAISQERNNGALRRIAMHPISKGQVVCGKILGRFLLGVVQIVYLLCVSGFFFGINYDGNLLPITTTLLTFALGCSSLGVFVGAVIRTPESVQGICTLGSVAMAALGGCWWPMEIVPDFAQNVGNLFPTAWAMRAMHQLFSFGGGFAEIRSELILLAGFAVVSSLLAMKFLKVH